MTDQVLTILKFVLLGLLYLFFARVLWAVWSEVRTPSRRPMIGAPRQGMTPSPAGQTTPMNRPAVAAAAATTLYERSPVAVMAPADDVAAQLRAGSVAVAVG